MHFKTGSDSSLLPKLADLRHNSDLTRLTSVTPYDEARAEKYKKAIEFLENKD